MVVLAAEAPNDDNEELTYNHIDSNINTCIRCMTIYILGWSKDDANDGYDDNDEDDDNDGDDDDDEKNNNTDRDDDNDGDKNNNVTNGEECDDGSGENDCMIVSAFLDERVYSAIETLKTKYEKANTEVDQTIANKSL